MKALRGLASIVVLVAGIPVAGACAQSPSVRTAEVVLAEQAYRHGDRADALRRAMTITRDYESGGTRWSSADRAAAGRAYLLQSAGNAAAVRQALAAFDAAAAADSTNMDARLRAAELLLDKYNFPDAKASFEDVLRRSPGNARALLGLARIAAQASDSRATTLLRQSLAAEPTLVDAQLMLARMHLEAESYDSAAIAARRAIASDSTSIAAWALLGATAWLSGDSAEYSRALAAARRINPHPSDFFAELAEAAARQRRYADGVRLAREALALDSSSTRAPAIPPTRFTT